jgi:hypothetical protein
MGKISTNSFVPELTLLGLNLLITKVHSIKSAATKSLSNLHHIHLATQIHSNQYKTETVMAHISHYTDLPL